MLPQLPDAVSSLAGRDLLRSTDLSPDELAGLLELAAELEARHARGPASRRSARAARSG